MNRTTLIAVTTVCFAAVSAQAALVWESTFDVDADGVVDVVDGNLTKDLIGPAGGGTIQINTIDQPGAFNDNDRGGRALGSTKDGNDSYSAYYKFNWPDLNEDQTLMWESVGFIGNDVNSTEQKIGIIMRHWKVGANYFVSMDLIYGEIGTGAFVFDATGFGGYGPLGPTAILLGANGEGRDLQLAMGYDGNTHELTAELYDDQGVLMSGNSRDLDQLFVPTNPNTVQTMLDALQVTHLGWSEYVGNGCGPCTTTWEVDTLAYYDDATGAFGAIMGGGGVLLGDANKDGQVTGADLISVQQNFGAVGPTPLQGDANDDGQVTGADLISVQQNFGAVAAPASSAIPEPATLMLVWLGAAALLRRRRGT